MRLPLLPHSLLPIQVQCWNSSKFILLTNPNGFDGVDSQELILFDSPFLHVFKVSSISLAHILAHTHTINPIDIFQLYAHFYIQLYIYTYIYVYVFSDLWEPYHLTACRNLQSAYLNTVYLSLHLHFVYVAINWLLAESHVHTFDRGDGDKQLPKVKSGSGFGYNCNMH